MFYLQRCTFPASTNIATIHGRIGRGGITAGAGIFAFSCRSSADLLRLEQKQLYASLLAFVRVVHLTKLGGPFGVFLSDIVNGGFSLFINKKRGWQSMGC